MDPQIRQREAGVTSPSAGALPRHRLHDLLREHARALAGRLDPDGDRDQAAARLLDYYQHASALADALLARQARTTAAPVASTIPATVPALAGQEQALAWSRAERANLIACLDHAAGTGQHARIIALTAGLAAVLAARPVGRSHHPSCHRRTLGPAHRRPATPPP